MKKAATATTPTTPMKGGGGKLSLSNRKEGRRKRKGTLNEGTRGCTRPEVFGKDAMKKDDRNHPNSMQHGNYRIENWKIRENMKT